MDSKSSIYDLSKEAAELSKQFNDNLGLPSMITRKSNGYACEIPKKVRTFDNIVPQIGDMVYLHKSFAALEDFSLSGLSQEDWSKELKVESIPFVIADFNISEKSCGLTLKRQSTKVKIKKYEGDKEVLTDTVHLANTHENKISVQEGFSLKLSSFRYLKTTCWSRKDYRSFFSRYTLRTVVAYSIAILLALALLSLIVYALFLMPVTTMDNLFVELLGEDMSDELSSIVHGLTRVMRGTMLLCLVIAIGKGFARLR